MKKIWLMCLALLWFSMALYAGGSAQIDPLASVPRLVILPFTGTNQTDGENIALLLSNNREMRDAFTVLVPRSATLNAITLQPMVRSGATDDTNVVAFIGRQFNADFVVTGQVKTLGDRNLVVMTMVKVETYQQITGGYREFKHIADIPSLLPDMVKKMIETARLDTSQMPTLAILPFRVPETMINTQDVEVLVQLLTIEIANSGAYAVLSQTNNISAIGKAINARYVLIGNVMQMGENMNLFFAQILNVETAALSAGGTMEYRTITDNFQLIPELALQLTGVPLGMPSISVPQNMIWISGGAFQMGSIRGEADETPVHTVQVSSFFMGKTPVTQQEYEAVIGKNPSTFKGDRLPVENVSWYDAVEYCNKLSIKEGLTPAYSGSNDNIWCNFTANGYRLPTEAEWEYAARGGNRDRLSFDYAGGNSLDILGWFRDNSGKRSHEIGGKYPNSLGLYDMAGNVWEWCWDWYGAYPRGNQQDPRGPVSGTERVNRGGSWNSAPPQMRSTYRSLGMPAKSYKDLGFRVLRPIF